MFRVRVHIGEHVDNLFVRGIAHRSQQCADGRLALAIDLDRYDIAAGSLELHPRAAIRYQLGGCETAPGVRVGRGGEVHARRAHELADDDALCAVDDESAVAGHQRDVADEQGLFLNLAASGATCLDFQRNGYIQRRGVCNFLFAAFFFGELGVFEVVVAKRELEARAGRVFYRRNLLEQVAQAIVLEPLERVDLHLNQVGHIEHGGSRRVRARALGGVSVGERRGGMKVVCGLLNR